MELLLGQIPEAIFFALFMIYAKGIKEKRILYTILIVVEYLLLINIFPYNLKFHISFMIMTYIILKLLYKEKSQITDIFILLISYIILGISSALSFFTFNDVIIASIVNRAILFVMLFSFKYKLIKIQKLYKNLWNRKANNKFKIKSTTFRALNVIIFNIFFYILNIFILYSLFLKQKG